MKIKIAYQKDEISTHALTWSATFTLLYLLRMNDISTHALTWSATHDICQLDSVRIFQLTRSRGARLLETITNTDVSEISTHALTWSATMKR